ncbi:hypothetical protein INQ23_27785, partial [Escherichia coli]|nr:hypothetical protein [Escherichia coli]
MKPQTRIALLIAGSLPALACATAAQAQTAAAADDGQTKSTSANDAGQ